MADEILLSCGVAIVRSFYCCLSRYPVLLNLPLTVTGSVYLVTCLTSEASKLIMVFIKPELFH